DLLWPPKLLGPTFQDVEIAVTKDGGLVVVGAFTQPNTLDFGTGPLNAMDGYDAFVAKLDASGNFVWATSIGGPGDQCAWAVAVDPEGHVWVGGESRASATLDGQPCTAPGAYVAFLRELDDAGAPLWSAEWGGAQGRASVWRVAADPDGHVVAAG